MQRVNGLLWGAALPGGAALAIVGALALRYAFQRSRIERSWLAQALKLSSVAEVEHSVDSAARRASDLVA
jgi:hypothetical protein